MPTYRFSSKSLLEIIGNEDWLYQMREETSDQYFKLVRRIERDVRSANNGVVCLEFIVRWLQQVAMEGKISQGTMRLWKSAALFAIACDATEALVNSDPLWEFNEAYNAIQAISLKNLPKKTTKTSSPKLKHFPKYLLDEFLSYASQSPHGRNIQTAALFLRANILAGLRPQEWFDAEIDRDEGLENLVMKVRNAKSSSIRANGEYRVIVLKDITKDELSSLYLFLNTARGFASVRPNLTKSVRADEFYKPLGRTLHDFFRKSHPELERYPTPYSTRHQAVANAKASGLSDIEIAALFGHASIKTAQEHYGSKKEAWGRCKWKPSEESVLAVRNTIRSSPTEKLTQSQQDDIENLPLSSQPDL
jgi:integrase